MTRPLLLLALSLSACSKDDDAPVDTDTAVDSDVTGPLSVYVEAAPGVPAAGVPVAFHDADGAALGATTTDANGRASFEVTGTAGVTAATPGALRTVLGARAGDEVRILAYFESLYTKGPTTHVDVAEHPGADDYSVTAGCIGEGKATTVGGFEVDTSERCRNPGDRVDLLAVAYQAEAPIAYTFSLDVPVAGPVSLPSPWRTDLASRTLAVEGLRADAAAMYASIQLRRNGHGLYQRGGGLTVDETGAGGGAFVLPPAFADEVESTVLVQHGDEAGELVYGSTVIHDEGPLPPSRVLSAADVPEPPATVTVDSTDVARPVFTWTDATPLDARVVSIATSYEGDTLLWSLVQPDDVAEARFPELPEELWAWRPTAATERYATSALSVDGLTAHELLTDWSVVLTSNSFGPLGDAFEGGKKTMRTYSP